MIDKDKKTLWKAWMLDGFTWWLDDAIKLLFGHDPKISEEQLALEGNDVIVRAGVSARKAIKASKLTPINKRKRPDNAKDYLLERDEFVKWAKSEFPMDGGELHEVWQEYKQSRDSVSKKEARALERQSAVDEQYVSEFVKSGKLPRQEDMCALVSKQPGMPSAATMRRQTHARDIAWLHEQIRNRKKPTKA